MTIEVPRDTGANAPRATWKVNGTLAGHHRRRGHQPPAPGLTVSATTISASLEVELEQNRPAAPSTRPCAATATGSTSSSKMPAAFAGRGDAASIRSLADFLARQDIAVRVLHEGAGAGHDRCGDRAAWWQRRATGSRHIRLGSLRGAWTSLRARSRTPSRSCPRRGSHRPAPCRRRHRPSPGGSVGPSARPTTRPAVAVPASSWRRKRSGRGSANPSSGWATTSRRSGRRRSGTSCCPASTTCTPGSSTTSGTSSCCWSPGAVSRVHGAAVERAVLRTGSRVELGRWRTLVFVREEWADHGRPHGGRIGGELGHQRPQGPRQIRPTGPFDGEDEVVAVLGHAGDDGLLDRVLGVLPANHERVAAQVLHQGHRQPDHHDHERQGRHDGDRLQARSARPRHRPAASPRRPRRWRHPRR